MQSKPVGNHYLVEPGVEKGFTGGVSGYVSFFSFFKALFAASRRFLNLDVEPAASPEARNIKGHFLGSQFPLHAFHKNIKHKINLLMIFLTL